MVICLERGANGLNMVPLNPPHASLASLKSKMDLPFWCQLTQVVLEKKAIKWV